MMEPGAVQNSVALEVPKDVPTDVAGVTDKLKKGVETIESKLPIKDPGIKFLFKFVLASLDTIKYLQSLKILAYCEGYSKAVIYSAYGHDPHKVTFSFQEGSRHAKVPQQRLPELLELAKRFTSSNRSRESFYRDAFVNGEAFYKGKSDAISALEEHDKTKPPDMFTALNLYYRKMAKNVGIAENLLVTIQID